MIRISSARVPPRPPGIGWIGLLTLTVLSGLPAAGVFAQVTPSAASAPSERLKERVRAESPVLAARRAALDVALRRRQAAGTVGPATLAAEAEAVPSGISLLDAGSLRLDLSRGLLGGPRRAAERDLADREVDRARLEVEMATRALGATVEQLVARASGASAIASRLASEDSLLVGTEEAVRSRFSVGDARYVDVLRVRTERLQVAAEVQRSRSEARIARLQLLRLAHPLTRTAGEPATAATTLVDAALAAETAMMMRGTVPPVPSIDSLLQQSGAIRLAGLAVERASAARRLVSAEQRMALTGSIGVQRFSTDAGGHSLGPTIGVSMTLPFTARRGSRARESVAEQEIVLATTEQRAVEAGVMSALASALDRYETARSRLASFDAALLRGAREEREAALASFRTGSLSLLELLDFERALAQAEITRIRSRVDAADALVDLYLIALGDDGHDAPSRAEPRRPENDR